MTEPAVSEGEARAGKRAAIAAVVALTLVAVAFGAVDLYNFDLGLARATGRYIVEHRDVPHANVFSAVHPERPFVDDKWLFHVVAYLAVDGVGAAFAVWLRVAALVLLGLLMLPSPMPGTSRGVALAGVLALVGMVTASERFGFRPELVSMIFLGAFARMLMRDGHPPRRRQWIALLALQVVWVSTHGYFVLGPILAGVAAAGALIDAVMIRRKSGAWREELSRLWLAPSLLAVCLINPYGWRLVWNPVEILIDLKANLDFYTRAIVEFASPLAYQPVMPSDLIAWRVLLVLVVLGLLVARRRARFIEVLPLLVLFWMSLDIRRNVAPFAVVAAPVAARWLGLGLERPRGSSRARRALDVAGPLALAVGAGVLVWLQLTQRLAVHDRLEKTRGFGASTTAHPDAEVDFVLAHLPPDGMFNSFSFGSYFVGRGWPERRPFIDGNTAGYDVSFFKRYADIVNAREDLDGVIDGFGLRYFLIKPGHPLTARLLAREDAVPLFLGRHACVVGLRGRVDDEVLQRFDLRRAIDAGSFAPPSTPPSTAWTRQLPTAELNCARFLGALGRVDDALAACDAASVVNPELYEPWQERGVILLEAGRAGEARAAFDHGLQLSDGVAELWTLRGMTRLQLRDAAGAESDLAQAANLNDADATPWLGLSLVALARQQASEGMRCADEAIARDPELYRAHLLRGRALLQLRRGPEAIESLRRALDLGPTDEERALIDQLIASAGG